MGGGVGAAAVGPRGSGPVGQLELLRSGRGGAGSRRDLGPLVSVVEGREVGGEFAGRQASAAGAAAWRQFGISIEADLQAIADSSGGSDDLLEGLATAGSADAIGGSSGVFG